MEHQIFYNRSQSIEDIAKKFGVTMRQKKPSFGLSRSSRYAKTQSMSFLETSKVDNEARLIVREFTDPFCFSIADRTSNTHISNTNNNNTSTTASRNKWDNTAHVDAKRRAFGKTRTDSNNNSIDGRKSSNRNSCTISFDELHDGKDEINAISKTDKPILQLWAQKNKTNAANTAASRNSYLGSPNDSKKILGQLSGTPWGRYLKNTDMDENNILDNEKSNTNTSKKIITVSQKKTFSVNIRKGPPVKPKTRPKSAYFERDLDDVFQGVNNNHQIPKDQNNNNTSNNNNVNQVNRNRTVSTPTSQGSSARISTSTPNDKSNDKSNNERTANKTVDKKQGVEYHNSFLDDLDELEAELNEELNRPPPPVPRRTSSKSSDLVDFFKKQQNVPTTRAMSRDSSISVTSTPKTTTACPSSIIPSSDNSTCGSNLSRNVREGNENNDGFSNEGKFIENISVGSTDTPPSSTTSNKEDQCRVNDDDVLMTRVNADLHNNANRSSQINMEEEVKNKVASNSHVHSNRIGEQKKIRSASASADYIHSNFLNRHSTVFFSPDFGRRNTVDKSSTLRRKSIDNSKLVPSWRTFASVIDDLENVTNTEFAVTRDAIGDASKNKQTVSDLSDSCIPQRKHSSNQEKHHEVILPFSKLIAKRVDIEIESSEGETETTTEINTYTDIYSQITGQAQGSSQQEGPRVLRSFSLPPLEEDKKRKEKPIGVASIYTNGGVSIGKGNQAKVSLGCEKSEPVTEIKTNGNVENDQPCDKVATENHKQICNNTENSVLLKQEEENMSGRYYTNSSRPNSNSFSSYYDGQQDSLWKTSSMSTQLSRHNNESANISDKYFGKKIRTESNDYSLYKNRNDRSYSLNDEYTPSYSTRNTRRHTSEDILSAGLGSTDKPYVPKSAYLRKRLVELKGNDTLENRTKRNSFTPTTEGYSNTSLSSKNYKETYEKKADEFIPNYRTRRSSEKSLINKETLPQLCSTNGYRSEDSNSSSSTFNNTNSLEERRINKSENFHKETFYNPETSTTASSLHEENLVHKKLSNTISEPCKFPSDSENTINTDRTLSEVEHTDICQKDFPDNTKQEISTVNKEVDQMDSVFKRRSSLKNAVARRFSIGGENKKKDKGKEEEILGIQESPFKETVLSSKSISEKDEKPSGKSSATITVSSKNRFGKEKSTFGNITKIKSSKISTASDLVSSKKKEKSKSISIKSSSRQGESSSSPSKGDDNEATSPDVESKSKTFSRFSLKKNKKSAIDTAPGSPPTNHHESKQRKHSLTHVFHRNRKEKDDSPAATPPVEESPVTSPTTQHNKDRRGSAFSRLFHHKKNDNQQEVEDKKTTANRASVNSKKEEKSTNSLSITVNSKSIKEETVIDGDENKNTDDNIDNSSLLAPEMNDTLGSNESLYDSDTSETATKRTSRNKERIRNRKLAKKEAAERHKSLPAGLGDVEIDISNGLAIPVADGQTAGTESPALTDATPRTRRKHRARRANTEFIGNVPLIAVQQPSPMLSQDDGSVARRNRRNRRDRPKTLMNGIDSEEVFGQAEDENGVVKENLSFSDIKKKLLEGLTDDKKIPDKVPQKERQKIKRSKSTKRYKTITEGIAPRDLELARQAMEAEKVVDENGTSRNTIDKDTLAQITAALNSTGDNRKSFIVESRPASRYQSNEDLRLSDTEKPPAPSKDDSTLKTVQPTPRMLQRTKSMTTLHLEASTEPDVDEPEIKPLSELKNRFLQAMEDTNKKHKQNKSPVDIKRRGRRERKDRPHTICGLDQFTMDHLQDEIVQAHKDDDETQENSVMDQIKNEINEVKKREEENARERSASKLLNDQERSKLILPDKKVVVVEKQKKREKKKYARANSEKIFSDIANDIDDILNEGLNESDLAGLLECNPSLAVEANKPSKNIELDLDVKGNTKVEEEIQPEKELEEVNERKNSNEPVTVNGTSEPLSDLDFISSQSSQLSSSLANDKRKLKPTRKQRTGANPMKSLQKRNDLIDEVAVADKQKEAKKASVDLQAKFLRKNDLADEAVSALRATVDFSNSKTKLRKVETNKKSMTDEVYDDSFMPTEFENLLVQVKGRRKCQTTLVEFKPESLNSNDCFIVCTPNNIMCWNGAQSNVIEKSKAAEVASRINQKKEMGCKAFEVVYVDQGSTSDGKVLRLLGGGASSAVDLRAQVVSDEDFEKTMISAYMTYVVCEVSDPPVLIPLDSQCHRMPTKEILQTDSAFVFDFITEVYVWLGRQTKSEQRKIVQKLAAEKFNEGYYKLIMEQAIPSRLTHTNTSHGLARKISVQAEGVPVSGRRGSKPVGGRRASVQQGRHQKREKEPRPAHSMLLQLFEGAEWVIFKEKFCDWPDESRIIRMKGGASSVGEVTKEISTDIQIEPVDISTMLKQDPLPSMVLDNYDVGRGRGIPKGMDGYHILTLDVKTWHVHENQSLLLPDESFGQFHSGEGYVIRWQYRIVKVRALRNVDDIMKAGGIERCCYFFWLGNDCSVNEEGATAVMTIELDSEKGPQIRVVLGKEPPSLLQLFDGSMIIHAGKRPVNGVRRDYTDKSAIRLYTVRHEEQAEACLLQVPACCESLRSRSSFVLLLCTQGEVFLWHGCKSNEGTRKAAEHAVQNLIQNHPEEAAIAAKSEIGLVEIEESQEPEVFWMALGGREEYGSLLDDPKDYGNFSPRLFHLESQTGQFLSHEISSPSRSANHNCPFPILQDDLYNVEQPAIFMLDANETVYLWFGWWPDDEEGTEASMSRRRRFDEERRKAMESAVNYANEVGRSLEFMYTVYAGLEPEGFIELFPYWVVQEDITELQLDEGIEEDEIYKITEELEIFSKEFYTLNELRRKPPPKGVDPTKLEKYLSEEDFMATFRFSKDTFLKLPGWQQVNWKKKIGLY